jgi:hypothetical protein
LQSGHGSPGALGFTRGLAPVFAVVLLLAFGGGLSVHAQVQFVDAGQAAGIDAIGMTYGPTWGDYNGDGLDDVFIGNHYSRNPMLMLNTGDGVFVNDAGPAGIPRGGDRHGAAWGDFNNDGQRDLYIPVGAYSGPGTGLNQFYVNLDGLTFEDRALEAGVTDSLGRGRFPFWIDVNNDGWLDLFVGNEMTPNPLFINRQDGTFFAYPDAGGLSDSLLWYGAWTRWDEDVYMDAVLGGGYTGNLRLFRSNGAGSFQDVTAGAGLPMQAANVQSLCWIDYDNDGDQDLYISRGSATEIRDALLWDARSLRFSFSMSSNPLVEDGLDGLIVDADSSALDIELLLNSVENLGRIYLGAALDHPAANPFTLWNGAFQGQPSIHPGYNYGCFIWQEGRGGPWHIYCSTDFAGHNTFGGIVTPRSGRIDGVDTVGVEPPAPPANVDDRLYENLGDGTFAEVTLAAGIDDSLSSRTVIAADFDNDGWQDLYVVSERDASSLVARHMPNRLWHNNGNKTFTECAAACGVDCQVPGTGSSAAWGDYDGNGFPDLYVTNGWGDFPFNQGPHVLYRNLGNANHWVKVRLTGAISNRDGIGARVRLVAGGLAQAKVQSGGVNDMAQSSMDLIFGLGGAVLVDTLAVSWPSGARDLYTDLPVDRLYALVEQPSAAVPGNPAIDAADADRAGDLRLVVESPARGSATLRYALPHAGEASVTVFDAAGRILRTLGTGPRGTGDQRLVWDGCDRSGRRVAPGIYYLKLATGRVSATRTLLLVR